MRLLPYSSAIRAVPGARTLTLMLVLSLFGGETRAQEPNDVHRLRWMAGCWERRTPTTLIEEQWMEARAGTMIGMSRTSSAGSTKEFEFLRIERVNGVVTYLAQPGGTTVTPFPATVLSDSMVTFSNPSHDFPQRVIYRRRARGDSLIARIEGTQGTSVRGIDFPMQRVACPAGTAGPG